MKYTPFVSQPDRYHLQLVFDYGEHTSDTPAEVISWPVRPDPFSEYKAGFEIRTYRLCQRVLMFHNFPPAGEETDNWELVKTLELNYERHPHLTYLTAVVQWGYHGQTRKALPPITFTYSRPEMDTTLQQVDEASRANLPVGLDNAKYQWVDLEGEGLAGIPTEQAGQWYYRENLGQGQLGDWRALTEQPLTLGKRGVQISDLNSDGVQELVVRGDSVNGYFEYQDGHWENFVAFVQQLTFDLNDPNLKWIDLTGDGLADIFITEGDVFTWYQSQGQVGFGEGGRFFPGRTEEAGPQIVFADSSQSIFLADMSGDGFTDIVRIRNGEVCYWPNLGYGRFGRKVEMASAPRFTVNAVEFNPRNLQLGDLDGSGTTDIFYLGNGQVEYWLNQAGNSFSAKQIIDFPLPFDSLTTLSFIDFTGSGTLSLVWSSKRPEMVAHQLSYLPLLKNKPHLLIEVDNHLGSRTHLSYVSSTRDYLADKQAGMPWVTKLPFPVQVLAQVETLDEVAGNRLVTQYRYHHGYYDPDEREFHGFGRVEVLDTESFQNSDEEPQHYVRPVLTKTWYHTGAYVKAAKISKQYEQEYYAGDDQAFLLADTIIENLDQLDNPSRREAYRALKSSALRQETYKFGNLLLYQVTEANFKVTPLQPREANNKYAVFFVHPHESLTFHYEQNPKDPRIGHNLTLEVDDYGNVRKALVIGYERQPGQSLLSGEDRAKQEQTLLTYTETAVTKLVDEPEAYRTPVPWETRTYELTGYHPPVGQAFQWETFAADDFAMLTQVEEIAYEAQPDPSRPQKRLIERERIRFRKSDLSGSLPLGQLDALALSYNQYKLAFTPGLLATYATTSASKNSKPFWRTKANMSISITTGTGGFQPGGSFIPRQKPIPPRKNSRMPNSISFCRSAFATPLLKPLSSIMTAMTC